ncbi:MAG TPA: DUF4198 domain-containing protein [Agitococcus sp.]|nr:DUF4198 domain-containing protein [Agitococcus sp.]
MLIKKTVVACALLVAVTQVHAHRQWLLPSSTQIDAKEAWVTIDGAVSENLFDFDTNALALDNLQIVAPDGSLLSPSNSVTTKFRSSADIKLAQKGTYKISQSSQNIMATYTLNGESKRWRGTEENMTQIPSAAKDINVSRTFTRLETYVTVDKATNSVLSMTTGQGLELLPLNHPNELFSKESTRFKVLLDGKPLVNHMVSIIAGGVRYRGILGEITAVSDKNGVIEVTWLNAGMYYLKITYPQADEMLVDGKRPAMPTKRYNYALTAEVLAQ